MINRGTDRASLSWAGACARRLERHALTAPSQNAQPADIAEAICGVHAQVMSAAEVSIGLRIAGLTRIDVRNALWKDRSLIKTYGPRGTVHLLAARDLPMWTGALSATPYGRNADAQNKLLTFDQTEAIIAGIAAVLEGNELTADELTEALVEQVGSWAGDPVMPAFQEMWPRWRMAQAMAGVRGALCFGANRGRNVTYTSPRSWLPGFRPAEERTALAELVKRYLRAYGPATSQQFAQWLAVPRIWSAELFDSLANQLQQVEFEGTLAWVAAGDTRSSYAAPEGVHLLPYFDAYVVGCHPRELLYPVRAAERALVGGQAGHFPTLLIGGVVAGVWQLRRSGSKLDITVDPLADLTSLQSHELDDQARRIGEILEGRSRLTFGTVTTGAHA